MRRSRRRPSAALAAAAVLLVTGCANLGNLQFRADHRLRFVTPRSESQVHLPVTLVWHMSDFTVVAPGSQPASRHAGYFAVFVDQSPIRPGASIHSIGSNDPSCRHKSGCPDAGYLAQLQIYLTTTTQLRLDAVQPLAGDPHRVQTHRAVVVLLDTRGRRIGEASWSITFKLARRVL